MDSISLVKKYVHKIPCRHCSGSGKCKCDDCKRNKHSGAMMLWSIKHSRPLPQEVEERDVYSRFYQKESERIKGEIVKSDTCYKCGGRGTVEKCNYERLEQEVQDGLISESERYAILKELGRLLPPFAFEPNE